MNSISMYAHPPLGVHEFHNTDRASYVFRREGETPGSVPGGQSSNSNGCIVKSPSCFGARSGLLAAINSAGASLAHAPCL